MRLKLFHLSSKLSATCVSKVPEGMFLIFFHNKKSITLWRARRAWFWNYYTDRELNAIRLSGDNLQKLVNCRVLGHNPVVRRIGVLWTFLNPATSKFKVIVHLSRKTIFSSRLLGSSRKKASSCQFVGRLKNSTLPNSTFPCYDESKLYLVTGDGIVHCDDHHPNMHVMYL